LKAHDIDLPLDMPFTLIDRLELTNNDSSPRTPRLDLGIPSTPLVSFPFLGSKRYGNDLAQEDHVSKSACASLEDSGFLWLRGGQLSHKNLIN
jgi:hypothetical protein